MEMCICSTERDLASCGLIRYHLHFIVDGWDGLPGCWHITSALLSPAVKLGLCKAAESISVLEMWE